MKERCWRWAAGACLALGVLMPVAGVGAAAFSVASAEVRTWTSEAGSSFRGSLKELKGDEAVLIGEGGRELTVRVAQLSPSDQNYLRELERSRHSAAVAYFAEGRFVGQPLPERAEVTVPHVVQFESYCVPASAEMILRSYGYAYDQQYLAEITSRDSESSAGTNFSDLIHALRSAGIDSVSLGGGRGGGDVTAFRMNGIRAAVAEGRPVLISYENRSSGHAVVVVGYDDRRRAFWVMDPAGRPRPERLDYKVIERLLTGAVVVLPRPESDLAEAAASPGGGTEVLRKVSETIRQAGTSNLRELVPLLLEKQVAVNWKNLNRSDLGSSRGQTVSYAREHGVKFVQMALDRGQAVVAPHDFGGETGLILLYGRSGNAFQTVKYRADGSFERGETRILDFSLRWLWKEGDRFLLPVLEIEGAAGLPG